MSEYEFEILFEDEYTVSGRVLTVDSKQSIEGVEVIYKGPTNGSVVTNANGAYSFYAIGGAYQVSAHHPSYSSLPAVPLTVSIDNTEQDFLLGQSQIDVVDPSVALTIPQNSTFNKNITIRNFGNVPLHYDVIAGNPTWSADGLWHESVNRFHSGTSSWYYGNANNLYGYQQGVYSRGSLTSSPVWITENGASFAFHEFLDKYNGSMSVVPFPHSALVQISSIDSEEWHTLNASDNTNVFKQTEIDLHAYAGQLAQLRFYFDQTGWVPTTGEGWYVDNFLFNDQPSIPIQALVSGPVHSAKHNNFKLIIDTSDLPVGNYEHVVVIRSNDPQQPLLPIPISLEIINEPHVRVGPKKLKAKITNEQVFVKEMTVTNISDEPVQWSVDPSDKGIFEVVENNNGLLESDAQTKIKIKVDASDLKIGINYEDLRIHTQTQSGVSFTAVPIHIKVSQASE